mgnify:FL=1
MALTEFTIAAAERVQRWSAAAWYELPHIIFFGRLMRPDPNAIIEEKRDLEGQPGDRLNYTLVNGLNGAGVVGDDPLEGQEEELDLDTDSVTLDQKRNAVRLKGRLSMKRTAVDQEKASKSVLKKWMAEVVDDDIFVELSTSNTRQVFGGNLASRAVLLTTSLITPAIMDTVVARAEMADPKIWPVNISGDDFYVLVMHPDAWYDLRQNSVWQGYQQNGAQVQGRDNPIFSGSPGVYNQIVLHKHIKVPSGTDAGAGANVPYAVNLFLGMQAAIMAWGAPPQSWVKEFDYGNSIGMAIGAIYKPRKSLFGANDHAVISLETARTNN